MFGDLIPGPVKKAARARAAGMGFPGSYVFRDDEPVIFRRSVFGGDDLVVDETAMEKAYAHHYEVADADA